VWDSVIIGCVLQLRRFCVRGGWVSLPVLGIVRWVEFSGPEPTIVDGAALTRHNIMYMLCNTHRVPQRDARVT
jgi:hypothetical protein